MENTNKNNDNDDDDWLNDFDEQKEKEKECKYFYVKMKLNDGCGKVRKKTGIVLVCPPPTNPPPTLPEPPVTTPTIIPVVPPVLEDTNSFYTLSADKSKVQEGETVVFTMNTVNVDTGSTVNYTIGRAETGITFGDIEWIKQSGGPIQMVNSAADLAGTFTVAEDGSDFVEIKLRQDDVDESDSEVQEQVIVQLNGLGISASCLVEDPSGESSVPEPTGVITNITIDPPIITINGGCSLINNHAQTGPKTASVNIITPIIAEGVL